jgi:hypothetical protein
VLVLEQQAGMLERALLAGGVHIDQHVAGRQDGGETVHRDSKRRLQLLGPGRRSRGAHSADYKKDQLALAQIRQIERLIVHGVLQRSNACTPRARGVVRYTAKSGPKAALVDRPIHETHCGGVSIRLAPHGDGR